MSCMAPLALMTSCFATLVTHLPIILLITTPTPIGRTSALPLSSGIRRLATIGSVVSETKNSVHSLLVSVAIDSHRLVLDLLKDLHAKILLKPSASTSEGPPDPLVLKAASLASAPLIPWYTESGMSSTVTLAQPSVHQGVFLLVASQHLRSAVILLRYHPH